MSSIVLMLRCLFSALTIHLGNLLLLLPHLVLRKMIGHNIMALPPMFSSRGRHLGRLRVVSAVDVRYFPDRQQCTVWSPRWIEAPSI